MSATMDADDLARFFSDRHTAPVISVPGRLFPIEERVAGKDLVLDAVELLRQGRNVLVFQPGKAEIAETARDIQEACVGFGAEIMPLHGELSAEDQQRCFKTFSRPKCVVATNVAQTSITIPDIDAVIDSGVEKRTETIDGIEGLYLRPISKADSDQRRGRAGRTKAGIYINHCDVEQPSYGAAEIMRVRLDRTVLRLASLGFDATDLDFFHQPDKKAIHQAKATLIALGCLNADDTITKIGEDVLDLPIDVRFARMIIEADASCFEDVLLCAALFEVGEITRRKDADKNDITYKWRALAPDEHDSDVLLQAAIYKKVTEENWTPKQMEDKGVHPKSVRRLRENLRALRDAVRGSMPHMVGGRTKSTKSPAEAREALLTAISAGLVEHVYKRSGDRCFDKTLADRMIGKESCLEWGTNLLVGVPFDIEFVNRFKDKQTMKIVRMATRTSPSILRRVAPHLCKTTDSLFSYYADADACRVTQDITFDGLMIGNALREARDDEGAACAAAFADAVADYITGSAWRLTHKVALCGDEIANATRIAFNSRRGREYPSSDPEFKEWVRDRLHGAKCLADVSDWSVLKLEPLPPRPVVAAPAFYSESYYESAFTPTNYRGAYATPPTPRDSIAPIVHRGFMTDVPVGAKPVTPAGRGPTTFRDEKKRWFACNLCNATQRVSKEQAAKITAGEDLKLTCASCGRMGVAYDASSDQAVS